MVQTRQVLSKASMGTRYPWFVCLCDPEIRSPKHHLLEPRTAAPNALPEPSHAVPGPKRNLHWKVKVNCRSTNSMDAPFSDSPRYPPRSSGAVDVGSFCLEDPGASYGVPIWEGPYRTTGQRWFGLCNCKTKAAFRTHRCRLCLRTWLQLCAQPSIMSLNVCCGCLMASLSLRRFWSSCP